MAERTFLNPAQAKEVRLQALHAFRQRSEAQITLRAGGEIDAPCAEEVDTLVSPYMHEFLR